MYSIQMCSFLVIGSRKMSSAGTRWAWLGNERKKITSRSSKQGANESNVFFIVLIAIYNMISLFPSCNDRGTYHAPPPRNMTTRGTNTSQYHAAKASIANILEYLELVLKTCCRHSPIGRSPMLEFMGDRHRNDRDRSAVGLQVHANCRV